MFQNHGYRTVSGQPQNRKSYKLGSQEGSVHTPPGFSFPIELGKGAGPSSNAAAIAQLEQVGRVSHYPARAAVFPHGDPANSIYIVRHGKLKLSLNSRRGRCVVFRFAVAEDLLGLSAVLNQSDHEFLAQTLEPSTWSPYRGMNSYICFTGPVKSTHLRHGP